jgi:hypothetical protein
MIWGGRDYSQGLRMRESSEVIVAQPAVLGTVARGNAMYLAVTLWLDSRLPSAGPKSDFS